MRPRRLIALAFPGLVLLASACGDVPPATAPAARPAASVQASAPIRVMTRNMYLGADIGPLLLPGANPAVVLPAALAQLQHTDYPARAQHLALEIAAHLPHAIGLQEVTHYTFDTAAGVQQLDFIAVLQAYLTAMGLQYDVAVRQANVTLVLPLGGLGGINTLTYTDGDAILIRHGVPWWDPAAGHYRAQATLAVGGVQFRNLRGWNALTVGVEGTRFRFVNTHLEIQSFRAVQEEQARELVALLQGTTLPVILVGDFNSAANASAPAQSKTASYRILRGAGFADLELREAHSERFLTCCHLPDLSDTSTETLDQRLDLVLARFGREGFGGRSSVALVGSIFADPHGYTLWPSDHSGVVATLAPAPGLLAGD